MGTGRRGVSLLEVIIASTVLALVMMAMFNIYPTSMFANRRAEHRTQASALGQAILEERRAAPFNSLVPVTNEPAGSVTLEDKTVLTAFLTITVEGTAPERLRRLRVTVSWQEGAATLTQVEETFVGKIAD